MTDGGLVFILSGPAGSGKGSVVEAVKARDERFMCAVSATSRPRLANEIDGVHYHYKTREEFERMIAAGEVLEYTEYCGNYYGTPVSEFRRAKELCKHLILEIEVDGAMQIKKRFPEAILVMVVPPDAEEQKRRLVTRGRDTGESIEKRLCRAAEELDYLQKYDYLLLNVTGALDKTVDAFFAIVCAEEHKTSRDPDFKTEYFK